MRAQTTLPVIAVALLVLSATTTLVVAVAEVTSDGASRDALDRQAAVALSERLVDGAGAVTARQNVLNRSRLRTMADSFPRRKYGVPPDAAVAIAVGDEEIVRTGPTDDGVSFERIILVQMRNERTLVPGFGDGPRAVTLPRRVGSVDLRLDPPTDTRIRRVLADHRVVLANSSGLRGTHTVRVSPYDTTTLRVDAVGPLDPGSVRLRYAQRRTTKRVLEVTVDA